MSFTVETEQNNKMLSVNRVNLQQVSIDNKLLVEDIPIVIAFYFTPTKLVSFTH